MTDTDDQTAKDFKDLMNMTKSELAKWLETEESQSVGIKSGTAADKKTSSDGPESTGHAMVREIIEILDKKKSDLTDDDYAHMRKVIGYIKRHLAQKPGKEDIETSRWRYSLMNWGHDPLK